MNIASQLVNQAKGSQYLSDWIKMSVIGSLPYVLLSVISLYEMHAPKVADISDISFSPNTLSHRLSIQLALSFIAILQWSVLRHHFQKAYWWIAIVVLGNLFSRNVLLGVILALQMVTSNLSIQVWVYKLFEGLAITGMQWFFFKNRVKNSYWWIVAFIISQLVAFPLYMLGPYHSLPIGDLTSASSTIRSISTWSFQHIIQISIIAIQSAFSGIVLVNFIKQSDRKERGIQEALS